MARTLFRREERKEQKMEPGEEMPWFTETGDRETGTNTSLFFLQLEFPGWGRSIDRSGFCICHSLYGAHQSPPGRLQGTLGLRARVLKWGDRHILSQS